MTITFNHRDVGTSEPSWAAGIGRLRPLTPPGPGDVVLVVGAHPDDETLGAGGLIATAHRAGAQVRVVVATDGEASHPHSRSHTPQQLAALRRIEVEAAVAELAPGVRVNFLGLPDGYLALHSAALEAQVEHFAKGCTHIVSPWSGDRHPDHEACSATASAVAAQRSLVHWQYPIWLWHWGEPAGSDAPWDELRRLSLEPAEFAAKTRAVQCHNSQHTALSSEPGDEPILSPAMLAHFTRLDEVYVVGLDAASPRYFDELYDNTVDPWGLADRWYEQRKREVLLAALPRPRFRRAFEPGCATGLLTERLAERCDEVVAWDVASRALLQTRARVHRPSVRVERGRIPQDWPDGRFDLILLSEVGYYCLDLDQLAARAHDSLTDDGVLVACHWRHPAPDHPQDPNTVHAALGASLTRIVSHVEDDFRLDVWTRAGLSVAVDEGIVP